ncbi:MAG: VirB3 family type IV secretion system protein [Sulfurimonas sp.]|jgi:type IV secretion system protein VirB4|uniref:VirB4 family type IV secretion/conjugal transfer ATPase n=1 Tax=Sulfurimonas sp. TaxID=2022749 RepID=UPI003563A734
MEKDILFKAMTRPAMVFGIPVVPFVSVSLFILIIAIWTNILFAFILIPILFIMRLLARQDDFIFRLLFLKFYNFTPFHNKKYYGTKTYHNTEYRVMPKQINLPKLSIMALSQNPSLTKFLPFSSLIDDDIVITQNYNLLTTFEIEGIPFELEDDDELDFKKHTLNMLFKTFASEPVAFYVHEIRSDYTDKLEANFNSSYLKDINNSYNQSLQNSLKSNTFYLTIIYNPFFNKLERSFFQKQKSSEKQKQIRFFIKKMHDYTDKLEASTKSFNVKKLKIYNENGIDYSKQLEFYNYLIGGRFGKVRALNAPLSNYLMGSVKNIQFHRDMFQVNYNDDAKLFGKALEIKDYTPETHAGMLNELKYLELNYTISQSFAPLPKVDAKAKLKKQENRLINSEDDSITQQEQFDYALDDLTNGDICFGDYHFSIVVFGNTIEQAKKNTNILITKLNEIGLSVAAADLALPATYFAQIPNNFGLRPRISTITSKNYSGLTALHNFPKGRRENNPWGDAITILKTPNGQPYYFNLHERTSKNDFGNFTLANTLSIGQSGGGKTAFASFLCNQLLKYDLSNYPDNISKDQQKMTIIYLDKDYGALGNILAAGGRYITLENGQPTGFNPFMLENTSSNIRNIQILIKLLVTRNGEYLSSSEEKKLNAGIDFVMNGFKKHERKFGISLLLENLTEDINDENSLKSRLELWKYGNKFGWVFDNENDLLDFPDDIKIFGIDGTEFLDDSEVSAPLSHYILMRSMSLIDGRRFCLFIDEAWKWLENDLVADEAKNKLKTDRKQNAFFYLSSQSPEDFLKISIAAALIEQSATQIFFANSKATAKDYIEGLSTTEKEFHTIKNFILSEYKCLIKRSGETAVVSLDLSGIGENLNILSTGTAHVEAVKDIFAKKHLTHDEKVTQLKEYYKHT